MSGLFIALEGIDASGKETQSKLLAEYLNAKLYTFPDYSTTSGKLIRAHLHKHWAAVNYVAGEGSENPFRLHDALVFQSLMLTNRMEKASEMALYLDAGGSIVADRYAASGLVYGAADGLDPEYIELIHSYLPQPDLYILLDIPVEESFRRRPHRGGDRYEEDRAKLEEVAHRYRFLFKRNHEMGKNWMILDGAKSPEAVYEDILTLVETLQLPF